MSQILKIEPTTKEKTNKIVKEVFPKIENPIQLELKKMLYYSFKKKYEILINETENDFLEILFVDGAKKKNIVQIFTKKMNVLVCSCSMFNDNQLNYCDHVATFNRILRDNEIKTMNKVWLTEFNNRRTRLPEQIEAYKGKKIKIFDPKNQKLIIVGSGETEKSSINIGYYKQSYTEEFSKRMEELKNLNISSDGLLINTNLYDYQEEIFIKSIAAKRSIISMTMGSGKAQDLNSKILTPLGWTTMGKIKPGDKIIGSQGTPITVTGVFPQGKKEMYKVTMCDGSSTICCDEHLWAISKTNNNFKIVELKHIMDNYNKIKYFIPTVNPIEFLNTKTHEPLYTSISNRIDIVEKFLIENSFKIKNSTIQTITTCPLEIKEIIMSLGGTVRTAGIKKIKTKIYLPKQILSKFKTNILKTLTCIPTRYITNIEYDGWHDAQCISVDAPDQLYVTDDYILTHNTITAISSYEWLRKNQNENMKLLIICPKSLKNQWKSEFKKRTNLDSFLIDKSKDIENYKKSNNLIGIVTYQLLGKIINDIKDINYDMIICDEMQFVKNKETQAWKGISKLKTEYMLGLSGTIIENKLDDLYNVMNIIYPKFLGPKWKFDFEHQNILNLTEHQVLYTGVKNISKLKEKLKNNIFSFDNLNLPPINQIYEYVELDSEERMLHDDNYGEAKILLSKSMSKPLSPIEKLKLQAFLLKSRQSTISKTLFDETHKSNSAKINKFLELIENYCINQTEKVILFSDFVEVLKIFQEKMIEKFSHLGYVFFTGEQNANQRSAAIKKFTTDPACNVIFLSGAGGIGLDGLQMAARVAIFTEVGWNPAVVQQRIARLARIGQTKETIVHHLVAIDTIETKMLETLERKNEIKETVLYK